MSAYSFRLILGVLFVSSAAMAQTPPAADTSVAGPTEETPEIPATPAEETPPAPEAAPKPAPPPPRATGGPRNLEELRHPEREWREDYPDLPEEPGFTEAHSAYWEAVILGAGEAAAVPVEDSATFAAETIVDAYAATPLEVTTISLALGWLDALFPRLDPAVLGAVAGSMGGAFAGGEVDVRPWLTVGPETEFVTVVTAMQTCLTLGLFVSAATLHQWIHIPEAMRGFLERHGIMLFDNDLLDSQQLLALGSVFDSIPFEVHGVVSVVVPQGMQATANDFGLRTPGLVLDVDAIPMDRYSRPDEFFPESRQAYAPEFTLNAAVQVMRAAQFIQFQQRPELGHRQATILSSAGNLATRYLRQFIAPANFQNNPNELVPQTSYLWFLDSSRAWGMALDLYRLEENETADTLLLVADTLSGGSDTTLSFQIDLSGRMRSQEVPLRRTLLAPGIAYASGIGIDNQLWTFGFDNQGGVTGLNWN